MDIEQIKQGLAGLNEFFEWEVDYIKKLADPMLFILDYSPGSNDPLVSFALSLIDYDKNQFPYKCWMTCNKLKRPGGVGPNFRPSYKEFSYKGERFYSFSLKLSDYKPKDVCSIKTLVDDLYSELDIP